jgi:hypothetical protein
MNSASPLVRDLRPGDLVVSSDSGRLVVSVVFVRSVSVDVTWLPMWGAGYGEAVYVLRYSSRVRILERIDEFVIKGENDVR